MRKNQNQETSERSEELQIARESIKLQERLLHMNFESTFFLPLFALLFFVSVYVANATLKFFFWLVAIIFVIIDLAYSIHAYYEIKDKQKRLQAMIDEKIRNG